MDWTIIFGEIWSFSVISTINISSTDAHAVMLISGKDTSHPANTAQVIRPLKVAMYCSTACTVAQNPMHLI
jgi:hypothetical protein